MPNPFHIVDVFTREPFAGNPVAVVLAPDESEATMRHLAGWTGMPETVFVTRPGSTEADYGLRIFSPLRELAFAGHPSIGACHLLLELGLVAPRDGLVTQECPAGLFEMRIDENAGRRTIAFTVLAETAATLPAAALNELAGALGAVPDGAHLVMAGAKWIVARFADARPVAGLRPNLDRVRTIADAAGAVGISVYAPSPEADADVEVRSFAPTIGVDEDAVCGSGTACVAAAIAQDGSEDGNPSDPVVAFTVSQGRHLGRSGRVRLVASQLDRSVLVAGEAVTTASGTIMPKMQESAR